MAQTQLQTVKGAAGRARRESVNMSLGEKSQENGSKPKKVSENPQLEKEFEKFRSEIMTFFEAFDTKMEKRLNQFEQKFNDTLDEIKREMGTMRVDIYDAKTDISHLKTRADEIEASVTFIESQMNDDRESATDLLDKYKLELKEMRETLLLKEKHDRSYNLLFYGFEENENENLESTMKTYFAEKLKIEKQKVEKMEFANLHRLPSDPRKGPKPIIIKFLRIADREMVFAKAFSSVLKDERKRILSDLPVIMKRERGRLASAAYEIRQNEHLKTRIVEKGLKVTLEVRKDIKDEWQQREV
jgi:tetrahydromethanopterin S-methyltransferase subunit G